MKKYQKHNLLSFIQENRLNEFTTNDLYLKISGDKFYYYCYSHTLIVNNLNELVKEGHLKVRYESVKVEPFYEEYSYNRPHRLRNNVGSKTVSVYRYEKS